MENIIIKQVNHVKKNIMRPTVVGVWSEWNLYQIRVRAEIASHDAQFYQ